MIEAFLLTSAIGLFILLLKNSTRSDTENPDELLGLFAYKQDKNDQLESHRQRGKRLA